MSEAPATQVWTDDPRQTLPVESKGSDPKPRTASEKLADRIAERRAKAERQRMEVINGGKTVEKTAPQRGPDGKFAPGTQEAPAKPEVEAKPKPPAADPAVETLKKEHAEATRKLEALQAESDELAELSLARITRLENQNKQLQAMLRQAGVDIDPRDIKLAQYSERDYAAQLQAEREKGAREAREQAERERKMREGQQQLENRARSVLQQHPELDPRKGQEQIAFWQAVYNGADPVALAAIVVPGLKAREQASTTAPRTLPRTASSGERVSNDPRDITERYKARLRGA